MSWTFYINYQEITVLTRDTVRINPFVPNAPFLYPLKTSENFMVF